MKIIKKQYKKRRYYCRKRPTNYFLTRKCVIFMKIHENHQKSISKRDDIIAAGARKNIFQYKNVSFLWKYMKTIKINIKREDMIAAGARTIIF